MAEKRFIVSILVIVHRFTHPHRWLYHHTLLVVVLNAGEHHSFLAGVMREEKSLIFGARDACVPRAGR